VKAFILTIALNHRFDPPNYGMGIPSPMHILRTLQDCKTSTAWKHYSFGIADSIYVHRMHKIGVYIDLWE